MPTKRKDGRLVQTITDKGKKIYFYGANKAELNRKILEYREKRSESRAFRDVANEWWAEAKRQLATQSLKPYKPALGRAIDEFGDCRLADITPKDILRYLNRLSDIGFAQKTVATHRIVVNRILEYAVVNGDIQMNPCNAVKLPKGLVKGKRSAALKSDEQIILETADVWLFPFIALLTGMRRGEILALQWKDIDFDRDRISVTKSIQYEGDIPSVKEPKTKAGVRVVPLLPKLKEALLTRRGKPSEYIISDDDGKTPLRNMRFTRLMKAYRKETGVTASAHQLRHSFATIAFEADVPLKSLQEILGHKQLSTTMDIYTEFREDSLRSAADLLSKKLG